MPGSIPNRLSKIHCPRRWKAAWLLPVAFAVTAAVLAGTLQVDPVALLTKALKPSVAYTCKRVVAIWHGKKSDSAVVQEWRLPGGRYRMEYLAPRSLRGSVLVSDGKHRWRLHKGEAVWQHTTDDEQPLRVDLLRRNYQVKLGASTTVVGRKAWLLDVIPKSKGKPPHRFWLDAVYGVPLKSETFHPDGVPASFVTVTEIRFVSPSKIPSSLFTPNHSRRVKSPRMLTRTQVRSQWGLSLPTTLPAGFVWHQAEEIRLSSRRHPLLHVSYTDGMLPVSLFVTRYGNRVPVGSSDTRLPVVHWDRHGHECYLIGDTDSALLHRLAAALR